MSPWLYVILLQRAPAVALPARWRRRHQVALERTEGVSWATTDTAPYSPHRGTPLRLVTSQDGAGGVRAGAETAKYPPREPNRYL